LWGFGDNRRKSIWIKGGTGEFSCFFAGARPEERLNRKQQLAVRREGPVFGGNEGLNLVDDRAFLVDQGKKMIPLSSGK